MAPTSFITLDGLRRRGWRQIPSGWLVESSRPLTSEQIADARDLAAAAGLTIETRRESTSHAKLIAIATAAGALLALAILAMTVGLIRSESAGDLRTLTATGATSRIRRTLTAATAGALALLGALLGVAGAYLALAATYLDKLDYLGRIPVLYLVLMVVGIPWRPPRPAGCSPAASRPPSPGPPSSDRLVRQSQGDRAPAEATKPLPRRGKQWVVGVESRLNGYGPRRRGTAGGRLRDTNGLHDASNAIATLVATRAATPLQAILWPRSSTCWAHSSSGRRSPTPSAVSSPSRHRPPPR